MSRSLRIGFLIVMGFIGLAPLAHAATCRPVQVGVAEAVMHGQRRLRPVVAARIDRAGASFIFDTGAASTVVFKAGAARLKLQALPHADGLTMRSFGQLVPVDLARVGEVGFAGRSLRPGQVMVVDSDFGPGIDGLLAPPDDLNLEIDLAHGAIRLFAPADCNGAVPADWPADAAVSTVELEPGTRPIGRVEVNGVALRALFDTGSPTASVTAEAARRVGMDLGASTVTAGGGAKGVGPTVLKSWTAVFARLSVGGETMRDLTLDVVEKPNASADMILGADFFVTHRVFVSRRERRLYAISVGPGGLAAQP